MILQAKLSFQHEMGVYMCWRFFETLYNGNEVVSSRKMNRANYKVDGHGKTH